MKIAVVSDDGKTISQHFGRAKNYIVFDVQGGSITRSEVRSKTAHHSGEEHHDHGEGGHVGPEADAKHNSMLASISDCEALIVRGMGFGAFDAMKSAGIKPYITDLELAEDAVKAYIAGKLDSHTERLH